MVSSVLVVNRAAKRAAVRTTGSQHRWPGRARPSMGLDCDVQHSFYCAEVETRTAKTDGDPRLPDSRQGPSGRGASAQARRRVDRMRGRTVAQSFTQHDPSRRIRAARGTELSAKSWQTEAPLRMLMNNLAPEVAERSEEHTSELQSRGHLVCRLLLEKNT